MWLLFFGGVIYYVNKKNKKMWLLELLMIIGLIINTLFVHQNYFDHRSTDAMPLAVLIMQVLFVIDLYVTIRSTIILQNIIKPFLLVLVNVFMYCFTSLITDYVSEPIRLLYSCIWTLVVAMFHLLIIWVTRMIHLKTYLQKPNNCKSISFGEDGKDTKK